MRMVDYEWLDDSSFISTGHLPGSAFVADLVAEAHATFADDVDGENSNIYPALAAVDPALFGICVAGVDGALYEAGDSRHEFSIMSVSKPFVFALLCEHLGHREIQNLIGTNATGRPFNSLAGVEVSADGRTNPMVNAGAIATTSLTPGNGPDDKWGFLHQGLSRFAGRELAIDPVIYDSASATNFRNRGIANFLHSLGRLSTDPDEATDLYTRQCALNVSALDLAVMGATLAHAGVNPRTGEQVIAASTCHYALAVMATAGMYETSGDWLYEVGLPGKSGIGGGIVTVSPGKSGLGTFAPRLDAAGNSVKGQLVAKFLSHALGLDLFASRPD